MNKKTQAERLVNRLDAAIKQLEKQTVRTRYQGESNIYYLADGSVVVVETETAGNPSWGCYSTQEKCEIDFEPEKDEEV